MSVPLLAPGRLFHHRVIIANRQRCNVTVHVKHGISIGIHNKITHTLLISVKNKIGFVSWNLSNLFNNSLLRGPGTEDFMVGASGSPGIAGAGEIIFLFLHAEVVVANKRKYANDTRGVKILTADCIVLNSGAATNNE